LKARQNRNAPKKKAATARKKQTVQATPVPKPSAGSKRKRTDEDRSSEQAARPEKRTRSQRVPKLPQKLR
jgi:hypothetical protein